MIAGIRRRFGLGALLALTLVVPAQAQWAIGAPDGKATTAKDRYVFFVASNPKPGQEVAFNEWYQQVHMGDLVQLEGWTGAQRFRLVGDVGTRPTQKGYERGYLIMWDQEGAGAPPSRAMLTAAQDGGKVRRSASFDTGSPTSVLNMTYRQVGSKLRRPDGRGPVLIGPTDNTHIRPARFIMLEISDPAPGVGEAAFEAALDRRDKEVLALPGWMATRRMRFTPTEQPRGVQLAVMPRYLTVWEMEGPDARTLNTTLLEAEKSGAVKPLPRDPASAVSSYWEPISPWIDKDDVLR